MQNFLKRLFFFRSLMLFIIIIYNSANLHWGTRWCGSLRHCATSRKDAGSISGDVTGIFIDIIMGPHYGPGVDSSSNRNEYQVYFLGVKAAVA